MMEYLPLLLFVGAILATGLLPWFWGPKGRDCGKKPKTHVTRWSRLISPAGSGL